MLEDASSSNPADVQAMGQGIYSHELIGQRTGEDLTGLRKHHFIGAAAMQSGQSSAHQRWSRSTTRMTAARCSAP